jgi:uncharacterized protein YcnI
MVRHRIASGSRLAAAAAATSVAALFVGVGAASAHIEPDPPAIEAGQPATVGFNVEHGCSGSNTTKLEIKIPDGISDAKPVDKPGWTAAVSGQTLTFSGGNLDAATADTFSVSFTAPAAPGAITFPIVQTCVVGDLAWLDASAPGAEPEHPAPVVKVTAGPPTSSDLAPEHDDGGDDATATTGVGSPDTEAEPTTAVPLTTAPGPTVSPTTAPPATLQESMDDSSNTGAIIGIVAGVVVVVGGAIVIAKRRPKR